MRGQWRRGWKGRVQHFLKGTPEAPWTHYDPVEYRKPFCGAKSDHGIACNRRYDRDDAKPDVYMSGQSYGCRKCIALVAEQEVSHAPRAD